MSAWVPWHQKPGPIHAQHTGGRPQSGSVNPNCARRPPAGVPSRPRRLRAGRTPAAAPAQLAGPRPRCWPRAYRRPSGIALSSASASSSQGGAAELSTSAPPGGGPIASAATPPASSSLGGSPSAASSRPRSVAYRHAEPGDFWSIADVHCHAFYPQAAPLWAPLLRLDRVLSLKVGG